VLLTLASSRLAMLGLRWSAYPSHRSAQHAQDLYRDMVARCQTPDARRSSSTICRLPSIAAHQCHH